MFVGGAVADDGSNAIVVSEGESIQTAINNADSWDTIYVETGIYAENLVVDVEGLTITAADGAKPVLEGTGDTGLEIEGAHNVTIEGFTIRDYGTYGIHVSDDGHNVIIQDNHIENSDRGIWLGNNAASDATIEGNTVSENGVRGIHVGENNENVEIRENDVTDNSGYGIHARFAPDAIVVGNDVARNSNFGISIWDENSVVQDNTVDENANVGISISHDGDYAYVENNTISGTVTAIRATTDAPEIRNNTISGSEVGLELDSVATATVIDNELDSGIALDGSVGTFAHFDHEMSGNTLAEGELVFIRGEDNPEIPVDAGQIIVVDSTNVNVSGFHLGDVSSGITVAFSNAAVVTDNIVENTGNHGIRVLSSDNAVVSHNELKRNGETSLVSGIGVHDSSGAKVSNNTIEDADRRAIHVGNSPDATLQQNTLLDNHDGIHITNSDRTVLQDNSITGTHHGGGWVSSFVTAIMVLGSEHVEIRSNSITDNAGNGIHDNRGTNSQYVVIEDNVIENNGNDGIYWRNSHDATIRNNIVANNDRTGIAGPMRAAVSENTVFENSAGIDVSHDSTVRDNKVFDNSGNGIEANADSIVRDNTITDNGDTGIFFRRFDGQLVENNTVSGHVTDLLIYETEDVTVRDNTFETGVLLRSWAVDFDELATHTFVNNTVSGDSLVYVKDVHDVEVSGEAGQVIVANSTDVTVSGLEISGAVAGVQVAFSNGTVVSHNSLSDSAGGFVDRGTITLWESQDSSVLDNVLVDNHASGIELVDSTGTNVSTNRVEGTDGPAVIVDSNTTGIQIHDNSFVNNNDGVSYDGWSGYDPVNAIDNWWGASDGPSGGVEDPETGTIADGDGDTVDENVLFDPWTTDDPDGPGPIEVGECTVIDEAGSYVLIGDITDATGTCIEITANDVTLDGQGYEIAAAEGEGTYGISIHGVTGVSVENLVVSGWEDAGIKTQSANDVTITGVTAVDNPGHGVHLESTSNSALTDLTVTGNEDTGIQLDGSSDNVIHTVTTHESGGWHGVQLDNSHRNTLSDVSTVANARDGITIRHSSDNVLENVSSVNNGQMGLRIADASGHEVRDSEFRSNDRHGVSLEPNPVGSSNGAHETSLTNVVSEENGMSGVNIVQSNQNSLDAVTITNNDGIGLNLMGSSWNTVEDTVSEENRRGILVGADMITSDGDSNYNSFTDVSVNGNERDSVTITDDGEWSNPAPSVGNEFERLTIGNHTVISFEGQMIELYSVDALPASPTGLENIGKYVEIVPESGAHVDSLSFYYDLSPAWEFDENDLELWRHDGAEWIDESDEQTLDADTRLTVEPESSQLGIFAPLLSVDQKADIIVYGGSVDSATVEDGELVTVTGNLFNAGTLDGNETVDLSVDGDVVDEANVTVAGGSTSTVELQWEAYLPEDQESESFNVTLNGFFVETVTVENLYSDIQVIAASTSENEVVTGEEFHVVGSIYQAGTIDGPEDIVLNATHTETDEVIGLGVETGVELSPGFYHLGAINITAEFKGEQAGNYSLQLGGTNAGQIEVEAAESDIQVIAASTSEDTVITGEEFYVVGSIYQAGNIEGTETVNLTATNLDTNDTVNLGSQEATLAPGFYHLGAINITAEFEGEQAGNYSLQLDDRNAGQIEVEAAELDIQVIAASTSKDTIITGEEFHVVGSIYQAGNIEGTEEINLTATNLDTNNTVEIGSQEATLAPGFYHLGAINITAEFDEPGNYSLQLGERNAGHIDVEAAESDIQVIAASASEDTVITGEEFYVVGSIYQAGNIEETETVNLTATNQDTNDTVNLGTQEATLAPGFYHLGAINISADFEEAQAGTYDLRLGERNAGQIEVKAAESDIQVIAAAASEDTVIEDEEFHVIGSIYQSGNIEGTEEINLTATNLDTNDTVDLGSQDATLAPGFYHLGAINISADFEGEQAGNYSLQLGDRHAGHIEVEAGESDIQVIAGSLSEMNVTEGEEFYVVGSIYQAGNIDGPQDIALNATLQDGNGEVIELKVDEERTLSPGFYHLGAINLTTAIDAPGRYDITLGDQYVGTVGVDESPSDINVIAASLSEIEVLEGEELYVVGSIYQAGESGTEEIELIASDQDSGENISLGSQEVTLESGFYHLGAINISFSIGEPGTYDLKLGDQFVGELEVLEEVSDIQVIAASVSTDTIHDDEEFYVIGSIYQAGNIEGTEEIELTATHLDTNNTVELGSQEATLAPGFYHLGAINITVEFDEPGNYSLQLGERNAGHIDVEAAESDINVIAASASATERIEGEEFHVVGSIYQAGNIEGNEVIDLTATNDDTNETIHLGSQEATLAPGFYHLGAINITAAFDEPGNYSLQLGERNAGHIEVEPAESDINVIAASASATERIEGEEFYVVGSIYQAGNIEGTEEIELTATNDDTGEIIHLGSQEVTLAPGFYHLGAINISAEFDEPGNYSLQLGERNAGHIEVEPAESDINVIAASASATDVAQGQTLYVVGSIYQAGNTDGPEQIEFTATHQETSETEVITTVERELSPGFYHLGAINVSFTPMETGTYDLALGDTYAGTIDVSQAVVSPSIANVTGFSEDIDPETEEEVVYASDDGTVEIQVESDLPIEEVTLLVDSMETTYTASAQASHAGGDEWVAEIPFNTIPDDGKYTLSVIAVDELGNAGYDNPPVVMIDRESPTLTATVTDVDSDDATVLVESDKPLTNAPSITVERPDGTTKDYTLSGETLTRFSGTIDFPESGEYEVTAVGTDRAGNIGEDTTSVTVNTAFSLQDGIIEIEETGTTIDFHLTDNSMTGDDLFVALSEATVNPQADGSSLGVGYLSANLDQLIQYQLSEGMIDGATIDMAIDETEIPDGFDVDDVELQYFDEGTGEWDPVDSSVTMIDDSPYVSATVEGFSTYGAVVSDSEPPTLLDVSPSSGSSLSSSTEQVMVKFTYEDEMSGVNISAVTFDINGESVLSRDGTNISSTEAKHELDVSSGESYTATVTVVDYAGNEDTFTTSFSVAESSSSPPSSTDPDPEPANISVIEVEPSVPSITAGESVELITTVENTGGKSGESTLILIVDGEPVETQTIDVPPESVVEIGFDQYFDHAGTYVLGVANHSVEITVDPVDSADDADEPPVDTGDDDKPTDSGGDDTPPTATEPGDDDQTTDPGSDDTPPNDTDPGDNDQATDPGSDDTPPTDTDQGDEPIVDNPDDDTIPGFGPAIAIFGILLSAVILKRRRALKL